MILDSIKSRIIASLKAGDKVTVETLRFIVSHARNYAIELYGAQGEAKITDTDVLAVISKLVKTHRESITAFKNAGRAELADKEIKELAILEEFLPKELTDDEIKALIAPVVAGSPDKNFGPLMGACMKAVAGRASGERVNKILKELVNNH